MGESQPELAEASRAWPSLASLAIVAILSLGLAVLDFVVERDTALRTADLVDRSLRSVQVSDDLRYQARRLADPDLDRADVLRISSRIEADASEQRTLSGTARRSQWTRLESLLGELETARDPKTKTALIEQIEADLDALVEGSKSQAAADAASIQRIHRRMLTADVVAGAITLMLVSIVALALIRSLRHQRRLLRLYAATTHQREQDLQAFTARAAHDLRGPLSPIKGYTSLLMKLDGEPRELGARISRVVDRMAHMLDDMLALATAGRPPPGIAAVDAAVHEALDELAEELRIASEVRVEVEPCRVACAPGFLTQVVHNLVSNAIKYRFPERPLQICVAAHQQDGQVEIRVADNGLGMTPDAASHAFEPFFRATGAPASGHGLGLAIVKRAIDALGGEILRTEENRGTEVVVKLPVAADEACAAP